MDEKKVREAIYCMKADIGETMCEECVNYYKCDHTKVDDMTRTAIEALEKQLPKKVENRTEYRNLYGHLIFYKGFCPSCGRVVESYRNNSCHICTQRLDWSE